MATTLNVNGCPHEVDADLAKPLLWAIREDLGLQGTKFGCGIGQCRACTVLVDGVAVQSCLYTLAATGTSPVRTIEDLDDDLATALREAWATHGASQCGYCQPGQVVAAYALLRDNPDPTDDDIDASMRNLCRCGTYQRIREAIRAVAASL